MDRRALIFATSRYRDSQLSDLASTWVDAKGLQQTLSDPLIGKFEVTLCLDTTQDAWRQAIEEFFADRGDELLLLYISGHAVKDREGRLYFAAADTLLDKLLTTAVSSIFIQEAANKGRSRQVVMVFDTCFSGAFARGIPLKAGPHAVNVGEYFLKNRGTVVIAACDAFQYALAGDSVDKITEPSLFTGHIIEGLRTGKADRDRDGKITTEDLFHYVSAAVGAATTSQRPERWDFHRSGDFVIASVPRLEDILPALDSALPADRLQAVVRLEGLLARGADPACAGARQVLKNLQDDDSRKVARAAAAALEKQGAQGAAPAPPGASWLGELTKQYSELGAWVEAILVSSDKLKELRGDIEAAREQGRLQEIDRLHDAACKLAIEQAESFRQQARSAGQHAAGLLASHARLATEQLDWLRAAERYEKAFMQVQGHPSLSPHELRWLVAAGESLRRKGKHAEALQAFTRAHERVGAASSTEWQRLLAESHAGIGEILSAQRKLDGALESYREALDIWGKLAVEPTDTHYRSDASSRSSIEVKIGEILTKVGELPGALESYLAALSITGKLADAEPDSGRWQDDLATIHNKIADLSDRHCKEGDDDARRQDLAKARTSYQSALGIVHKLIDADPNNVGWQNDLSAIRDKLAKLAGSHSDTGDALSANRHLARAQESYQTGLGIIQELLDAEPANGHWQQILSAIRGKLVKLTDTYSETGELLAGKDPGGALESYQTAGNIIEDLVAVEPHNIEWQCKWSAIHRQIGAAHARREDMTEALNSYTRSLEIIEKLARGHPVATELWGHRVDACFELAVLDTPKNHRATRKELLSRALLLVEDLRRAGLMSPELEKKRKRVQAELTKIDWPTGMY